MANWEKPWAETSRWIHDWFKEFQNHTEYEDERDYEKDRDVRGRRLWKRDGTSEDEDGEEVYVLRIPDFKADSSQKL